MNSDAVMVPEYGSTSTFTRLVDVAGLSSVGSSVEGFDIKEVSMPLVESHDTRGVSLNETSTAVPVMLGLLADDGDICCVAEGNVVLLFTVVDAMESVLSRVIVIERAKSTAVVIVVFVVNVKGAENSVVL
jgi:hypothetical protein